MLTLSQKKTAQAIVNLFETGVVLGDYGSVTLIAGDTGHLTFGRSQTTLTSGNLEDLLQRYCANPGARFRSRIEPHLPRFATKDLTLDTDRHLHNVLRATADDPVMRETQDIFFDQGYWEPAERAATNLGVTAPLGVAVVYDSRVHGSWSLIRDRTNQQAGDIGKLGERAWISAYVDTRMQWLATHSRPDLRATVYRMDAFRRLLDQEVWGLDLPLVVRGAEISLATLNATPPGCYDGPQPGTRSLAVQTPLARGLDVRLVQLGLSSLGVDVKADGIFGQTSSKRLREHQLAHGLPPTGVADTALIASLVAAGQ
jgi:chitosanase